MTLHTQPFFAHYVARVLFVLAGFLPGVYLCASNAHESASTPLSRYNLRSWTTRDGLPNNRIGSIAQSKEGYLWLGSQNGLARFDGAQFKAFDRRNTPLLPHNEITSLIEDGDSTLWIGTIRGLVRYHRGAFSSVPVEQDVEPFIATTFFIDRTNRLFIGCRTGVLQVRDNAVARIPSLEGSTGFAVYTMREDDEGRMWLGTDLGLKLIAGNKVEDVSLGDRSHRPDVTALCFSRDSVMWVGTAEGLFRSPPGRVRRFEPFRPLLGNGIRTLCVDVHGDLWIGTDKNGLYRLAGGRLENISTAQGLSANTILSVLEDREGNIWAGTYYNGLNEIWRGKFETISTAEGLAGPQARAIAEGNDGTVWIGTQTGLSRWKGGRIKNYSIRDGLVHDHVRSVYVDHQGTLWIGTVGGVSRFDGTRFVNYGVREGLSFDYTRAIIEDFDGNLLIGHSSQGVDRLRNGKFENMDAYGIPRVSIRVFYRGRNRTLWIGTDRGLIRWRDGESKLLSTEDGLCRDVFSIHEDKEGTLWVGSYGDGLYRIKGDAITKISEENGLGDDVVHQILEDGENNLWLSSNNGVFRVALKQLNDFADGKIAKITHRSFGTPDGMRSSECNGNSDPSGIWASDGRLWFPTTNGVAIIDPANIGLNTIPPPVVIEAVTVDGLPVDPGSRLSIPAGYNHLEFQYSGLSFIVPENMVFSFKLEGYDRDWHDAGTRRAAYYTNIPPGDYVFRVRARNYDGFWSIGGGSLRLELKPYFVQTVWFYVLCGIILVGSGFLWYRWRVAALLQRDKELQRRVDETLASMKILGGLVPICASCKKIRDDKGYWNQLEKYLQEHSEAQFTHGICPDCKEKLYGDFLKKNPGTGHSNAAL